MTAFILTPIFKKLEDRVDAIFGMGLKMLMDLDVAPVANFLGEIGGIENKLGCEVNVFFSF